MAVSASPWPISTPTLKLTMFATSPFGDSANSWSFVARPKPWNRPKISTADPRVRLEAEEPLEAVHVLERLVDDREADDGVDENGLARMPPSTPASSVTLWPMVNRLTYWTTSFRR